jgi:hypothetical protein
MTRISCDIQAHERYLKDLKSFQEELLAEQSALENSWFNLRSSWNDSNVFSFEEQFEDLLYSYRDIEKSSEVAEQLMRQIIFVVDVVDKLESLKQLA